MPLVAAGELPQARRADRNHRSLRKLPGQRVGVLAMHQSLAAQPRKSGRRTAGARRNGTDEDAGRHHVCT
jgi:hypothetical protein